MSNSSEKDETGIMQSLMGVRRLKNDKVDIFQNSPKKKYSLNINEDLSQSSTLIKQISHNIPTTTLDSWFHHGIQKKSRRKIKMGQLTIDAILDLHGHRQHEAAQELESFIHYAVKTQARLLLIIHGKGFNSQSEAVLRPLVQHWLSEQNMVLAYCPAQAKDGGAGASYVYLKNQSSY